jgi:hypothetical protein
MSEKRFTVAGKASPLNDVVMRAMQETGKWSVPAMRSPGFRNLEQMLQSDPTFRAAAPLSERAQIVLDNAVVEVGLDRLTFVADILSAGLTYNLSDPLSVTQLEWYKTNKIGAAQRTMSPSARGENKLPDRLPSRLPVYLTIDQFELDIRTLRMSQRVGLPLDTAIISQCTRSVNEAIEDAAINGATTLDGQELAVDGYSAPGLLNAPDAEAQALTAASWDVTPVGATIYAEVQAALAKLRANKRFGPYRMYVPVEVGAALDSDYDTVSGSRGLSIRERLLKIEGLQAIRTADLMPPTKVAFVQMTSDVIDMVVGQPPTVIPWTSVDGFTFHNLIMAIMIPRVRSDYDGNSGICIGTIA